MRFASLAGLAVLTTAAAAAADGPPSAHEERFRELGAETLAVREEAAGALARDAALTEDELRAALREATPRAKPHLLRIAAARGMTGAVPEIVADLPGDDPVVSDAAVRALVSLGDDAVKAGLDALAKGGDESDDTRTHLTALAAQRAVEREVIAKWRRKGGQYEGRYNDLARLGWPVQPVLLAMLLDVPLSDRDVVLPQTDDPNVEEVLKLLALSDIEQSNRRGYRTFEPLPLTIESEELFEFAAQAMKDVADIDLVGDILERTAEDLKSADEHAPFRLRPVERYYSREIDVVLFNRGRPERLRKLAAELEDDVDRARLYVDRRGGTDGLSYLCEALSEYANALHQLHEYDESAATFAEVIRINVDMIGARQPAIAGYNRACALARGGHEKAALDQLESALDPERSAGAADLTEEWVTEDGDLASLRDEPRYKALIKKRFGK